MPKKKTTKKKVKPLTWDDVSKWPMVSNPMRALLDPEAMTPRYFLKKLKRELIAKETKTIKIKGALKQEDLPRGFKIIGISGMLEQDKEGNMVYGDGETIIRYDPAALGIRQKARQDGLRYAGMEPAEKTEPLAGDITLRVVYGNKSPKKK